MPSNDRAATPTRRALLGAGSVALASGLAGCSGRVAAGGNLAFEAAPAGVADAALAETGYERADRSEAVVTREYGVAGLTREVRVENAVTRYDRTVDLGVLGRHRAGAFAVVSSPQVRLLWETFNPLDEMGPEEIAARATDRYENVRNVTRDATYRVSMLGDERTVTRYAAEALLVDGRVPVDVYLHVSEVASVGEDFVVAVGAHPQLLDDGATRRLFAGVEHSAER